MAKILYGGWTDFSFKLSSDAQKVFTQALDGLTGVEYTPLAVATQPVNGVNYCFLCEGKTINGSVQILAWHLL